MGQPLNPSNPQPNTQPKNRMSAILKHRFHVLNLRSCSVILADASVRTHTIADGVAVERNEVHEYTRVGNPRLADALVFALALSEAGLELPAASVQLLHRWREWANDPIRRMGDFWMPHDFPNNPAPGSAGPVEIAVPGVATVANP